MRKTTQRQRITIVLVGVLLGVVSVGVIAIVHAGGLATQPVGKISGDLVITAEDGTRHAVVTATQTYMQATKEGTVHVAIRKDGARLAMANARIKADTQEQAAAAVSSLILFLTGRPARPGMQCSDINEGGRGLQCSDIRSEGDSRVFAELADKVIDWWDAHARLTYTGYVSPRPDLTNVGKLQLNVWNEFYKSFVILLFDPANPTIIIGGRLVGPQPGFDVEVTGGTLTENTVTTTPGDFLLHFQTGGVNWHANLAIDAQSDGTIDVRGRTTGWPNAEFYYVVEGTGNMKFVLPGH